MSFSPCIIIPVYNHGAAVGATLAAVAAHGLPVYLVDDGSDAATAKVLDQLVAATPQARLLRRVANGGKGAAVMSGMRAAFADGHSHALQVDADGQHALADIPGFLAAARANPQALICGVPEYDASVPRGRLYGRYATHVWVWIETLSLDIKDSMCGFRVYPLGPTHRLIDEARLGARMDFDIEVLVRLFWRGVRIVNRPTRVTYPEGGVSHFQPLRDNLRISWLHTRLFFGMLARLPLLLARKVRRGEGNRGREAAPAAHWSKLAEVGAGWGLNLTFALYRLLGERAARLLLHPIVFWFTLFAPRARRASRDYLTRLHGVAGFDHHPGARDHYRHLHAFADAALDKVAAWMGRIGPDRLIFEKQADLHALRDSGRGAVVIGSHLGSLETARALAAHLGQQRKINAIVYTDHAIRFNALLARANPGFAVNLIQVSQLGPDTAIELAEKIERGELLFIVGDRTPPGESERNGGRVSRIEFLGAPAPFAQGPFILASLLKCPVYLFFCLAEGEGARRRYHIHFEHFAERIELPRHSRGAALQALTQRYADRLAHYCRRAPLQWFNFYDFWHS